MKFNTKVIHAGIEPDPATGAIMTPIYQTSTFVQEAPGVHKGYEYARAKNPTRSALEANVTSLEEGVGAACFGSGLAAMDAIMKTLKPGDQVVSTNDLYGGSYRQMMQVYAKYGIEFKYIDMLDAQKVADSITEKTKMLWIETPSNPMLNIIDIKAICSIAKDRNVTTVVDNTFASPYLQKPLVLGADIVLHSATKYLGGHSDVLHGIVVWNNEVIGKEISFYQNASGAIPGPQDCFLVLRGIKTLHLRVQRSCENAWKIAQYLREHPNVDKVFYPRFEDHKNHLIAKNQMTDYGGMVTFSLKEDTLAAATKVLSNTHYFSLAESLGGVESLIGHPATMTHGAIPREDRLKIGLTDSLIRLSVGVEDCDDLLNDLEQALKK